MAIENKSKDLNLGSDLQEIRDQIGPERFDQVLAKAREEAIADQAKTKQPAQAPIEAEGVISPEFKKIQAEILPSQMASDSSAELNKRVLEKVLGMLAHEEKLGPGDKSSAAAFNITGELEKLTEMGMEKPEV